ncbi:hypothetical protein [Pseudofrankia sp. DC12]|uniref:hypothetical protein n=1 Tax=Pseudofrankia sp. DC12 TaxID=683315 RepID=UPI0012F79262|nr:hypothetical protein [Pseudofrankia sp. DC12]
MLSTRVTSRRARATVTAVALAVSAALAGCSTGDDPKADSTAPSQASVSAAKLDPMDYVYTQGPETAAFTVDQSSAGAGDPTSHDKAIFLDIDGCMGQNVGAPSAVATGPTLTSQDRITSVDSNAEIVTPAQRAAHLKELTDPRLDGCIKKLMGQSAGSGGSQDDTIASLTWRTAQVPAGALARVAYTGQVTSSGVRTSVYLDVVFLGAGRVENEVAFFSASRPPDETLVSAVSAQLAAKLKSQ